MAKGVRKNANGTVFGKSNLPTKPCAACGRPFAWRKKWAKDWAAVKFCSDACRAASKRAKTE